MNKYKITMKNGSALVAESKWLELCSIQTDLNDHQPFARIGDAVLAKDAIASIEKIEEEKLTEEKEN